MKFQQLVLSFVLFLFVQCAFAQKIYNINWKQESALIGTGSGLLLGAYLLDNSNAPISTEQILNLDKLDVSNFDSGAISNYSIKAASISDILKNGLVVIPFSLALSSQGRENGKEIFIMYSEVASINLGLTLLAKASTSRFRPYAYNPDVPLVVKLEDDTRRSFFSGHVSHVASMSFFTASVYSDLHPDSNYKYLVWAGAVSAPAMTAYLRYKGGMHFPTDVLVGYGVGALIGYFIPKLHKIKALDDVTISGTSNGLGVSYIF